MAEREHTIVTIRPKLYPDGPGLLLLAYLVGRDWSPHSPIAWKVLQACAALIPLLVAVGLVLRRDEICIDERSVTLATTIAGTAITFWRTRFDRADLQNVSVRVRKRRSGRRRREWTERVLLFEGQGCSATTRIPLSAEDANGLVAGPLGQLP